MANTPKRRSQDKSADAVAVSQKCYCVRCGTAYSRKKGFFPVSHSPMYRGSGYLPWCNDCIDEMYEEYIRDLGDKEATRRMCMKMDLYWSESIYTMAERSAGTNSRIRNYIGKTNIIRYIDKTFDDTLREEAANAEPADKFQFPIQGEEEDEVEDIPTDPAIIEFWGPGFDHDFYMELERHYKDWTGGIENLKQNERTLYKQICMQEVIIARDAAAGRPTDKSVNLLNTLLGSMNLKPSQQKEEADAELEKMPLGVGIQKWEFNRPLPETPKENRDVRRTIKNITTWYLGHACKMVGLKNSYTRAYEEAMNELRVKRPEYDEEDDDSVLNDIFGGSDSGHDDEGGEE